MVVSNKRTQKNNTKSYNKSHLKILVFISARKYPQKTVNMQTKFQRPKNYILTKIIIENLIHVFVECLQSQKKIVSRHKLRI